jgi:hypothetical protein
MGYELMILAGGLLGIEAYLLNSGLLMKLL